MAENEGKLKGKAQLIDAIKGGNTVLILDREVRSVRDFPADMPADTEPEGVLIRDHRGHLTRAGMEHAIKQGGSVLIGDTVVTSINDLPDEEELERQNQRRNRSAARALEEQIGRLQALRGGMDDEDEDDKPRGRKGGKLSDVDTAILEDELKRRSQEFHGLKASTGEPLTHEEVAALGETEGEKTASQRETEADTAKARRAAEADRGGATAHHGGKTVQDKPAQGKAADKK